MHDPGDDVAVTIKDVLRGEVILIKAIHGQDIASITACEKIPLGHKVSIRDIENGDKILKYGHVIGVATQFIPAGAHVHIHNIRSLRWS